MPKAKDLLEAARKLDWLKLQGLLMSMTPTERGDRVKWLVAEIRQQGYAVCRRDDDSIIRQRDEFLAGLRRFLETEGHQSLADEWKADDDSTKAVEWAYHRLLATVQTQCLPPDRHVWATLKHLERRFAEARDAALSWRPEEGHHIDPTALKITMPDGSHVNPDSYIGALNEAATSTLKMFGFGQQWFDADSCLILPNSVPESDGDEEAAANEQGLSMAWQILERSDEHLRFFGGEARMTKREIVDENANSVEVTIAKFELNGELAVIDRIAHDRRSAMLMRGWNQLLWESNAEQKISNTPPQGLPPGGWISDVEVHAVIAMSHMLCKPIAELTQEYGGLRLIEWIRGYSALALFASAKLAADGGGSPCRLRMDDLRTYLTERGLTEAKAGTFTTHLIFRRNAADLFDSPILMDAAREFWLCPNVARSIHPVEVVFSKLATLRSDLAWRGPAFEETIRALFEKNGIPARHIKTKVGSEELEVDCVVVWDNILFVFECKNVSLAGKTNESTFRFYQAVEHAIDQVTKKRAMLLANPEILEKAFGHPVEVRQSVRVVLNAMPFSSGKVDNDLYVYDYSCLNRFFEDRYLRITMPAKVGSAKILRRHGVKSLWSGDKPSAADLIAEMAAPLQLKSVAHEYEWVSVAFPIGPVQGIETWRILRQSRGMEAMLNSIGVDGSRINAEIEAIGDEFSEQVEQLREKHKAE